MDNIFNGEWRVLGTSSNWEKFSALSDTEKREWHFIKGKSLPYQSLLRFYKKESNLVVGHSYWEWKFSNNRFYIKRKFTTVCTVTPKRVFKIPNAGHILAMFFKIRDKHGAAKLDARNIRRVLTKGPDAYVPPTPVTYNRILLADLKYFTTSAEVMLERLKRNGVDFEVLVHDMLYQAKALNIKIKSEWSDRKLRDKHSDWTEEISKIKAKDCSETPIWLNTPKLPEGVTFINSEKECAQEGFNMHHCLYSNYFYSIASKKYIALHVAGQNPYTIGMRVEYDRNDDIIDIKLDQAFGVHNRRLYANENEEAFHLVNLVRDYYIVPKALPF
jgi:hypothetical protein